jgi:hypothetical protein
VLPPPPPAPIIRYSTLAAIYLYLRGG